MFGNTVILEISVDPSVECFGELYIGIAGKFDPVGLHFRKNYSGVNNDPKLDKHALKQYILKCREEKKNVTKCVTYACTEPDMVASVDACGTGLRA